MESLINGISTKPPTSRSNVAVSRRKSTALSELLLSSMELQTSGLLRQRRKHITMGLWDELKRLLVLEEEEEEQEEQELWIPSGLWICILQVQLLKKSWRCFNWKTLISPLQRRIYKISWRKYINKSFLGKHQFNGSMIPYPPADTNSDLILILTVISTGSSFATKTISSCIRGIPIFLYLTARTPFANSR